MIVSLTIRFIVKLNVHHFKLQGEEGVVHSHLHNSSRAFRIVDTVQTAFENTQFIFQQILVVPKQFYEKLINNNSHLADIPNSLISATLSQSTND